MKIIKMRMRMIRMTRMRNMTTTMMRTPAYLILSIVADTAALSAFLLGVSTFPCLGAWLAWPETTWVI